MVILFQAGVSGIFCPSWVIFSYRYLFRGHEEEGMSSGHHDYDYKFWCEGINCKEGGQKHI